MQYSSFSAVLCPSRAGMLLPTESAPFRHLPSGRRHSAQIWLTSLMMPPNWLSQRSHRTRVPMHKPWHSLRYLHMSDTGLCHRECQSRHWPGMLSTASTSGSCRLQCMYVRPMLDSQMLHTDSSRPSSVSCRETFQMCHPSLPGWRPIISRTPFGGRTPRLSSRASQDT